MTNPKFPLADDPSAQALDDNPEVQILPLDAQLPPLVEVETPHPDGELPANPAGSAAAVATTTPEAVRGPFISLSHHQRKCRICKDPQRDDIEQDFLDWWSAQSIVSGFGLGHVSALYRHAHATGLFARRRAARIFALERMIEKVSEVKVTAFSIVMAMRVLNDMLEKPTSRARRTRPSQARPATPNSAKQTATPRQPNFRVTP